MTAGDRSLDLLFVAACPFPCARGTPIRAFRLAEALHRRGHRVRVVTYHFGEPEPRPPFRVVRIPTVPFYRRLAPGPTLTKLLVLDPLLTLTLWNELKRDRPDVVHAHHYEGYLAARLATGREVPVAFDVHTLLESELPAYGPTAPGAVKRGVGKWIDSAVMGGASHLVAVSDPMKRKLQEAHGVPPDRITVIPSGVEDHLFRPPGRPAWRGEPGTRTLLYAGSLAPFQGVETLLEVFARVKARVPEARLLIVTDSEFDPYRPLARRLGVLESLVVARSDFEELPRYLAAADVALNVRSRCDGVPQKILNYMAAGRPIVSFSGYGGYLEHRRSALLIPEGDSDAMAKAAVLLLEDEEMAARLGREARRRARSDFAWSSAAAKLEELYAGMVRREAGSPVPASVELPPVPG